MTIHSFDILLSQFGTSSLLHASFLTCIQVSQEAGKSGIPFSWWVFQFVVIHTKALAYSLKQKEIFFWNSLIFLWSSRCWQFDLWFLRLFKSNLYIWKFSFHILLKPMLKDFEHYFASMWNGWDCEVVWTLFGIVLLWDWNENWLFPILWPLINFPNLLAYWVQHSNSIIF